MKNILKKSLSILIACAAVPITAVQATDYKTITIPGNDSCISVRNGDKEYQMSGSGTIANSGYMTYTSYEDCDAVVYVEPEILTGGKYKVEWYNVVNDVPYASDIIVDVYTDRETDKSAAETVFSQLKDAGEEGWFDLGTFDFTAGKNAYFTVKSRIIPQYRTTRDKFIYYNCMKLTLIEEDNKEYSVNLPKPAEDDKAVITKELPKKQVDLPDPSKSEMKLYVSPGANGDGSISNPFGTIEAAQEKVKQLNESGAYPKGGITVYLREGDYYLPEGITLSQGGTEEAPLFYSSYENETARISTSMRYDKVNWKEIDKNGTAYKKIPKEVRDSVYEVPFSDIGMENKPQAEYGVPVINIMTDGYINARYPNDGTVKTGARVNDAGSAATNVLAVKGATFTYIPHSLTWDNSELIANARYRGVLSAEYVTNDLRLGYVDKNNILLSTANVYRENVTSAGDPNSAHYIYNLLEELDAEGEYVIDYQTYKLYFIPKKGGESINICKSDKNVITVDAKNVILYNLDVGYAVGCMVKSETKVKNLQIIGGKYHDTASSTLSVLDLSGKNIVVRDLDIYNAENTSAAYLRSFHDEELGKDIWHEVFDGKGENNGLIENCVVHDTQVGIGIGWSNNNTVRNNYFYNIKMTAFQAIGFNNMVEYNLFENVCYDSDDVGAMYAYCHNIGYGNVYRYNIIKNALGRERGLASGIYLDDRTSGFDVYGNIMINISDAPFHRNSGDEVKFHNNIVYSAQSGRGFGAYYSGIQKRTGSNLEEKITELKRVVDYNGEELTKKIVPELWDRYEKLQSGEAPPVLYGSTLENSIIFNCSTGDMTCGVRYTEEEAAKSGLTLRNLAYLTPEQTNWNPETLEGLDFDYIRQFVPGFQDIPVDEIGIYTGGARTQTTRNIVVSDTPQATIYSPANGDENMSNSVQLKWSNVISEGTSGYEVYIAENEELTKNLIKISVSESELDLENLSYGKTYYWTVVTLGKIGNENKINHGGIQHFSTMSLDIALDSEFAKCRAYLLNIEEGDANGMYPAGTKKEFADTVSGLEKKLKAVSTDEEKEALIASIKSEYNSLIGKKYTDKQLSLYYYDDFETDEIGERASTTLTHMGSGNPAEFGGTKITADLLDENNSVLRVVDDHDRFENYAIKDILGTKCAQMSVDIMPKSGNGWCGFMRSFPKWMEVVGEDEVIAPVHFYNGKIYAGFNKEIELMDYEPGKWYNVKIYANLNTGTYDVYIDSIQLADGVPLSNGARSGLVTEIGRAMAICNSDINNVKATRNAPGEWYIDNFLIFTAKSKGISNYAQYIRVNGNDVPDFDLERYNYNLDMTKEELKKSTVEAKAYGDYTKTYVLDGEYGKYVIVFSGDGEAREYRLVSRK